MLAKRKKPTRAAHAVNTLAHEHPEEVGSYLDLAADMRAAQIAAARDDRARDELRTRDRARREQLAALLARVPDDRDDVERALTTALVDTEVSDAVRAGHSNEFPTRRVASMRSRATSATYPRNRASAPPTGAATKQCRSSRKRSPRPNRRSTRVPQAVDRACATLDEAERHANAATRRLDKLREQRARRD